MRILYGVNGEGMGHATRSEVVIGALLGEHDVRVMAWGAGFRYLGGRLGHVSEIFGPSFAMEQGEIRRWASRRSNTRTAARRELDPALAAEDGPEWRPDVVVTDFEPLSGIYARRRRAARSRRQHQHDRSLRSRRRDRRRASARTSGSPER